MIEEQVRVVAVQGARVWVEAVKQSACGSCSARGGCGTSVLGKVLGVKSVRVEVNPDQVRNLRLGEQVWIAIEESELVQGTLWLYGLPLFALLGGALLGTLLAPRYGMHPDLAAVLSGGLGLVGALLILRQRMQPRELPRVLRREGVDLVQLHVPG
ncbi:MAG: SoxR reducing system RseC family protein [Gammaproteobacteria bacterium]